MVGEGCFAKRQPQQVLLKIQPLALEEKMVDHFQNMAT
jgi:hypothetical protein